MTSLPVSDRERKLLARDTLLASDLCRGLENEDVGRLLAIAQSRALEPGSLILSQGREADAVYLPASGHQLVERSAGNGQRQILAFLQRGDYLGFSSSHRFLYSARTLTPSIILRFPARSFYKLSEALPALRDNVGQISNQVLARVLDHLFVIGQKRAHARLAFLLWQLWQRAPEQQRASALVELPMRRVDIGDYLGLTLETTSRAFSRLRNDGLIATAHSQQVELLNPEALRRLAEVG
jgi:CRP-like cAMP-binding protein